MAQVGIAFQPDLIGVMSQFSQFQETLKKHIATATEKAARVIGDAQIEEMDLQFNNPTGALADSVSVQMVSEYMAYIGPTLPYSWRRDRGFSGMTDVLGRFFPYDPGVYYAEFSVTDATTILTVSEIYIEEVYAAWQECIGNLPGGTNALVSY